jgi:lysyl-tRNA synthetase class 1
MSDDAHRAFWADEVADEVEARDPAEPVVLKGGVSPSGVPHVGHVNEIMRGCYVAAVLRERGHEVRQVFTADDRDPLRKVPRTLADLDWTVVGLDEVDAGALGRNLGAPLTDVPDPFGCCDSFGAHQTELLRDAADRLGVPIEVLSNTDLYADGSFEPAVRTVLERADTVREVLVEHQAKVDGSYVPFNPVCESCGTVTETVTDVDLDRGAVAYECTGIEAGGRTIEGCGHRGEATLREGKLPWRLEWPAQWTVLGVDFEPFGKDHAEGSWPSGQTVAREVFDREPPVPMVYEWFTVGGEPLSSSSGTVVTVPDLLELVEPEVLRYFFAKDPAKQRDLDLSRVDLLVDEFDRFERLHFGEIDGDEAETAFAERAYPFVVERVEEDRLRLPYTFAAVLGMTDDRGLREQMARNEGHIPPDAAPAAVEAALERVERARAWAEREDNQYNYRLQADRPNVSVEGDVAAALDDLAAYVAAGHDGEAIQGEVFEAARRHGVEPAALFEAGYRLFFALESGPKLGPLLGALDREFVVDRLRREG